MESSPPCSGEREWGSRQDDLCRSGLSMVRGIVDVPLAAPPIDSPHSGKKRPPLGAAGAQKGGCRSDNLVIGADRYVLKGNFDPIPDEGDYFGVKPVSICRLDAVERLRQTGSPKVP